MTNRLANQTSPYLRQHAENPVDWYPWGPEALSTAQTLGKPILVSIGYSACHWCHVMAHESFEDERIASLMNQHFINIKVDREERPDVDSIYMEAVQGLTGSGGWPLNVFLTPDARPFFGGTYFPPQPRHGLPSWQQVLEGIAETFVANQDDVLHNARALTEFIERAQHQGESEDTLGPEIISGADAALVRLFDLAHGGFGSAPKFPQPLGLEFVLRRLSRTRDARARQFVELTLDRMAAGGIHDQIGGGFHRYSVDAVWLVPHFEKMLYDNALLARVYTSAYLATNEARYRTVAESTLEYMLRDLRSPEGGFFSSQDADSDGEEGRFYVWTIDELESLLSADDAEIAAHYFGVTREGNFEGKSILTQAASVEEVANREGRPVDEIASSLDRISTALLEARNGRVRPATDKKILVAWNALAIRSLAEAGRTFQRLDFLDAGITAMNFILTALRPNGRLVRSFLDGPGEVSAFLEDYACCVEALLTLHMTVFDDRYLHLAEELAREMIDLFHDGDQGAFFDTASDSPALIVRPRNQFDNPIPSGNSAAAGAFTRLEALTGRPEYAGHGRSLFRAARSLMSRAPSTVAYALSALDFELSPPVQIAIVGDSHEPSTAEMIRTVYERYLPNAVIAVGAPDSTPLLANRGRRAGRSTAYVCSHFVCEAPVTDPAELARQLDVVSR